MPDGGEHYVCRQSCTGKLLIGGCLGGEGQGGLPCIRLPEGHIDMNTPLSDTELEGEGNEWG
jgi:hypothetical protein